MAALMSRLAVSNNSQTTTSWLNSALDLVRLRGREPFRWCPVSHYLNTLCFTHMRPATSQ
ncbi:hypothetical protein E2C01_008397 [Portunus trituberculatus]|uniref:Uncharacterized protein n=1 Tax=Portunus trituberculatus TaxID=210409 RepID=A0A5B7D293_PORTR|nr:hypothetical protein [Portunus trituberculatus]